MKIVLILLCVCFSICAILKIAGEVFARREKERFDAMTPEERRKHQEKMYKLRHWQSSI